MTSAIGLASVLFGLVWAVTAADAGTGPIFPLFGLLFVVFSVAALRRALGGGCCGVMDRETPPSRDDDHASDR